MSDNKIKMVDLQGQYLRIKKEIDMAIQDVLDSSAFIQGEQVKTFEESLSKYVGGSRVISCANGTDALQIAMMALGFKSGDEVILPVHTYVATAEVIALLGLKPVFIDVNESTFTLDVDQLESRITKKTVAIVPVHLYGQCADMEKILEIASRHNLHVIEDAAQSLGADYIFSNGKICKSGTMGIVGCTSFFPSKNLGCFGDGGALFTSDDELAKKIRMIANHGQEKKYHHEVIGVNSRLDTIQAAILNVKLKHLDDYAFRRNEVAGWYDLELQNERKIFVPVRNGNSTHVFHQYTLICRGIERDFLNGELQKRGIPSMIYYPVPLHLQNAYRSPEFGKGSFPVTEMLSKSVISLPIHTEMTQEVAFHITKTLKEILA